MRIMFVCMGNICRSPLAHAVFEKMAREAGLDVFVESSGTDAYHVGEQADSRMRRTAAARGVTINHYARRFNPQDLDDYDLIIPMDKGNLREVKRHARSEHLSKIHLMRAWDPQGGTEVPDPWYGGDEGFENVFSIVDRSCRALTEELKAESRL